MDEDDFDEWEVDWNIRGLDSAGHFKTGAIDWQAKAGSSGSVKIEELFGDGVPLDIFIDDGDVEMAILLTLKTGHARRLGEALIECAKYQREDEQ